MGLQALLDGLAIPIVQAPMLGASGVALARDVSAAGALGSLAAAGLSPDEIATQAAALRAAGAPFLVNLLVVRPVAPAPAEVDAALARLAPWYEAAGVPPPEAPNAYAPDFAGQLAAVAAGAPAAASFAFGLLTQGEVDRLHAAGTHVIGQPRRSPRRGPGRRSAPTESARRAPRRGGTAAISSPPPRPAWWGPWRWSQPFAPPSTCR